MSEVFDFSTYTWGLPTQCVADSPRTQTGNAGAPVEEAPQVQCVDEAGLPVLNARIRSQVVDGNGTATPVVGFTDETGSYGLDTWVLGDQGANSVELFGLGLFGEDEEGSPETFVPHEFTRDVGVGSVRFEATAAGAPANLDPAGSTSVGEAEVGTTLPEPLVITVLDDGSNSVEFLGVPGVTVTWTVTEGNGTLQQSPASDAVTVVETTTNDEGRTSVIFTLGTQAGNNTVTAAVGDLTTSYTAVGTPGAPAQALVVSGAGQVGEAGEPLPEPVVIRVEDSFGNGIPGLDVSLTTTAEGGSFNPNPATTDENGLATTVWTLGETAGVLTATAEVLDVSASLTAEFAAEATCLAGTGTAVVDGVFDEEEWACAAAGEPFQARFGNETVPATLYWMNDAENLYLALVVEGPSPAIRFVQDYPLRFDFDNDGDGSAASGDDAIEYNPRFRVFADLHLNRFCLRRNTSTCGVPDRLRRGTRDGKGAFTRKGDVAVYELSHPLNSGDRRDIAVSAGDELGVFLTLRRFIGPVRTYWPGFREYLTIPIR